MLKRIQKDINDLRNISIDTNIDINNESVIYTTIVGPNESMYKDKKFIIRIELPQEYPYKSPSVGFITKIFHPNVDYNSGSVCLNVLNQTWSPIYNLCHIYDTFIPQLLVYPNPEDPLNIDASELYKDNIELFKKKVDETNI